MWGLRRRVGLLLGAVVLLASCGGGDGDEESSPTTAAQDSTTTVADAGSGTTEAPDDPAEESEDQAGESGSPAASAANKASVTIGDTRYDFDVEASVVGRCDPDFFGAFWVIASGTDDPNSSLEMFIVPEGNANHDETSRVAVNLQDAEGRDWRADEDGGGGVDAGVSRVESFAIDGTSVSGTVSFIDTYGGDGATAEGTFEATCP